MTASSRTSGRSSSLARRASQRLETKLVTLAIVAVESLLTFGLAFWTAGWPLWMLLHVVTGGLAIWWALGMRGRRRAQRFPALLAIMTATLGLAGIVGIAFASLAQQGYRTQARSFQTWYFTLFPPRTQRKARAWYDLAQALGDEGAGAIESFADLIRFGDIDQKLAIVALLARRFEPRFAPVLRAALQDPDASVRVQAATASAHIEDAFVERWVAGRRQADARGSDPQAIGALARLLDDYAFAGILDERREAAVREEAEACFREALALNPADDAMRIGLGRLLIRLERHSDALAVLAPLADRPTPEAAGWLMEALFRLGRFDDLRRVSAALPPDGLPDALEAAVALWRPTRADPAFKMDAAA